jgi:hypothetical protein
MNILMFRFSGGEVMGDDGAGLFDLGQPTKTAK